MKDKVVLITGGTGSWGEALITQLIEQEVTEIRVFARNENMQFNTAVKFNHTKVKTIVGDIRDRKSVYDACKGVDVIYHLAALKHVPICEYQPMEAIKTNILGTQNIVDVAIMHRVKQVMYVSTDKAVDPSSTYGFTKALGEKLILQANEISKGTRFTCLRSGNVLGSNGSVIPLFKKQMNTEGMIKLTDKRMTRFFVPIEQAIALLIKLTNVSKGGEVFVMKMPAFKILDIAEVMKEDYQEQQGNDAPIPIVEIGARAGEKLNESLITASESDNVYDFDEDCYVVLQNNKLNPVAYTKIEKIVYNSEVAAVDKNRVKEILMANSIVGA